MNILINKYIVYPIDIFNNVFILGFYPRENLYDNLYKCLYNTLYYELIYLISYNLLNKSFIYRIFYIKNDNCILISTYIDEIYYITDIGIQYIYKYYRYNISLEEFRHKKLF